MSVLKIKDGDGNEKYLLVSGDGSEANPYIPQQKQDLGVFGQRDAFGRLRVSEVTTLLDAKQTHDDLPLFFDEVLGGTATSSHSASLARTRLTTAAGGDYAIRQTFQRFNYQSGKSQQIFITGNGMQNQDDVVKRVGYFNSSTAAPYTASLDGIWLESDGSDHYFKIYRSGTEVDSTPKGSWNYDTFDGNGPSGITLNLENDFIYMIDFEWLGVGTVSHYFVINGQLYLAHQDHHANIDTEVYMSSPNHSIRYEIRQNGITTGRLFTICATVGTEGALNKLGVIRAVANEGTAVALAALATKYPVLAIRLGSSYPDAFVDIIDVEVFETAGKNCYWELQFNPTLSAGLTYSAITNSSLEKAVGNGTITVSSNGYVVGNGYVSGKASNSKDIENALRLGMSIAGTADQLVLVMQPLAINATAYATLNFRELI